MASNILSPQSAILPNTAAVICLFPTLVGAAALVYSRTILAKVFDFELPTTSKEQKLADNLVRLYGTRDLAIGGSVLALWYLGERRALGCVMWCGAGMVTLDGFIQRAQTGKGAEKHWPLVPVMAGLAAGLMGWLDRLM